MVAERSPNSIQPALGDSNFDSANAECAADLLAEWNEGGWRQASSIWRPITIPTMITRPQTSRFVAFPTIRRASCR
jgi:hypothetical protein